MPGTRLLAPVVLIAILAPFPGIGVELVPGTGAELVPGIAHRDADPWFASGRAAVAGARALAPPGPPARNVILFVGDGMGSSTVTAARILEGQRSGGSGEEHRLSFEALPHVALAKTYNTNQQVPDSAGTMTAMMSGVKTKAGLVGMSDALQLGQHAGAERGRVPTLFEEAEARGLSTGLVTTTRLTHATPAACYGHSPHRDWETDSTLSDAARKADFPDLARQLVEFSIGDGIDVALGGGRAQFLPANGRDPEEPEAKGARWDERDLAAEWQTRHPDGRYVWNREQFEAVDPEVTERLLGLFDPSHMEFEIDRAADAAGEPSLREMTAKAIRMLARNPTGFVLMVEGGRIDHGHHAGNAHRALTETVEFAAAAQVALDLTSRSDTLVVVTADHGHTMTIGGYPTRGNPILGKVVDNDLSGMPAGLAKDGSGRPFTTLVYANGPGHLARTNLQPEGHKRFPHFSLTQIYHSEGALAGRPDLSDTDTEDPFFLQESAVPSFAESHSGEDVAIYAGGPGASLFHGVQEQHFVYHALVAALGWTANGEEGTAEAERAAGSD